MIEGTEDPAAPDIDPNVTARRWLARLDREGASIALFVELRRWLAANPSHSAAYAAALDDQVEAFDRASPGG